MNLNNESGAFTQESWNFPHVDAELYLEDSINCLGGSSVGSDPFAEEFLIEINGMDREKTEHFETYGDDRSARLRKDVYEQSPDKIREERKKERTKYREQYPTIYGNMHYRLLDREIDKDGDKSPTTRAAEFFERSFPDWDDYESRPLHGNEDPVVAFEGWPERMWLARAAENALTSGDGGAIIESLEALIGLGDSELIDRESVEHWINLLVQHVQGRASQDGRRIIKEEVAEIVNRSCVELCKVIAEDGMALRSVEWRDLERIIATALDGIGFDVKLTEPSKDGGKDVIAECILYGHSFTYFLEIKHWRSGKRVAADVIYDFVEVNAIEMTDGGLVLSSSGFTHEVYSQLAEVVRRGIVLGDDRKIVSLCQHFVRRGRGLWTSPQALPEILYEGTIVG